MRASYSRELPYCVPSDGRFDWTYRSCFRAPETTAR